MITFLRRKKIWISSAKGIAEWMTGDNSVNSTFWQGDGVNIIRNDQLHRPEVKAVLAETDLLVRGGVTTPTSVPLAKQINCSQGIHAVSDKAGSAYLMAEHGLTTPVSMNLNDARYLSYPAILRPRHHAQGKNLWRVDSYEALVQMVNTNPALSNGWYAREYVPKVWEGRVYVASGHVVTVAEKTPDNPDAIAWNAAQGGRFDVMKWGAWPMEACRVACEAMSLFPIDFGGVDVMMDEDGKAYVIEINSAPSLPYLSDGSVSYRQKCMGKVFKYWSEKGAPSSDGVSFNNWKECIHPAIQEYK